jgi:hypothetical protein
MPLSEHPEGDAPALPDPARLVGRRHAEEGTAEAYSSLSADPTDALPNLQRAQAERLTELMRCRPGQKQYRPALRAFLDADADLERAVLRRLVQG